MLAQIQMFSKLANSMSKKRIIYSYITDIFSKIANPIASHPALLDCDRDYFTKLAKIDKKQTVYRFVREKFIHYREIVRNRSLFHNFIIGIFYFRELYSLQFNLLLKNYLKQIMMMVMTNNNLMLFAKIENNLASLS